MIEEMRDNSLVIDIETSSHDPKTGEAIDIRTRFEDYVKYAICKWIGMYSYKNDEVIMLDYTQIKEKKEIIQQYIKDHDIIIGFNIEEFDLPIMFNNDLMPKGKKFNVVDNLIILGASTFQRHDGLPFKNRGALMGYKFKRNSLKFMAEAMELQTQKGDIDYTVFHQNSWTPEEKEEIKKYLKSDVLATKQMFDKLWNFWSPFTQFISEENVKNLSWIKSSIASLTYKAACHTLGVEETYGEKSDKPKEEMGGRVIEPKYEEARNVWYVDFASLYPHIFCQFNLFEEIPEKELYNLNPYVDLWHGNDLFTVKGYYDIMEQHPLAEHVQKLLIERARLKKEDPDNPKIYAIKIFLNSLYGAVRSEIFEQIHTPNAGWDCCWLGQQIQEYTEKRMKDFGFETIAGDTDSIFVVMRKTEIKNKNHLLHGSPNEDYTEREYLKDCLLTIVYDIKANVPFPAKTFNIDIEDYIDYIMYPFSLQPIKDEFGNNLKNEKNRLIKQLKGKKKNYVYIANDKVKIKGLSIIKDNSTPIGRAILKEKLKPMILSQKTAKFSKELIENIVKDYLSQPNALNLLAVEYKVKPFSSYKKDSQIQAQISKGYFEGQAGVISLIKNKKYGKAGKTAKYCTIDEAKENNLKIEELDLTKLKNELEPFLERTK
jgi:DNA polymerase elongation subunit (family B)